MSGLKPFISSVIANVLARGVTGNTGPGYPSNVTGAVGTSIVGTVTVQLLNAVLTGIRSLTGLGALPPTDSKSITGAAATVSTGAVGNFRLAPIFGTNLSGMEWAKPGLRYGNSSAPNRDFTVARASDVQYLANSGMIKSRLPIQWELLQPVLTSQPANSVVLNAYNIAASGDFAPDYRDMITSVLDAHAAAGTKVILDCHNYCRYQDYTYNADGSVTGFTPNVRWLQPYTTNGAGVRVRIFSLAANATLTQNDFNDFWRRAAQLWGNHPGLGGYDIMNEPNNMPVAGSNVAWNDPYVPGSVQDYTIWPTFAQGAINAIRAVDPTTPIYLEGNEYSNVMQFGDPTINPGFPLSGNNIVYNAHMYLDAYNNGANFSYDFEVAKNYSAGEGGVPISVNTMYNRLKLGTDWAALKNVKFAITETGMPIDDQRWADMFKKGMDLATAKFVEVYTWIGGNHWPIHNYAINQIPAWHQNKTVDPLVAGYLKQQAGTNIYSLFDAGDSYGLGGTVLTITLFIRGYSNSAITVNLARTGTGTLSASSVVIPAGPNSKVTFTYTTAANEVATITYSGPAQVPPPRKVFSIADPVAYAGTSLTDAALTVMAKYKAAKWEAADGYTDYMLGAPAVAGDKCRAISDSGYASTAKNIFEMTQWLTEGPAFGNMTAPVMRVTGGKKNTDHLTYDSWGFWCRKSIPDDAGAGTQQFPDNLPIYNLEDPHFIISAVTFAATNVQGVIFQTGAAKRAVRGELRVDNGVLAANWVADNGVNTRLNSPTSIAVNTPYVVSAKSTPGAQQLRLNKVVLTTAAATISTGPCDQHLLGWGYTNYYEQGGFGGNMYGTITGKGYPSDAEMILMERYLGALANLTL